MKRKNKELWNEEKEKRLNIGNLFPFTGSLAIIVRVPYNNGDKSTSRQPLRVIKWVLRPSLTAKGMNLQVFK